MLQKSSIGSIFAANADVPYSRGGEDVGDCVIADRSESWATVNRTRFLSLSPIVPNGLRGLSNISVTYYPIPPTKINTHNGSCGHEMIKDSES